MTKQLFWTNFTADNKCKTSKTIVLENNNDGTKPEEKLPGIHIQ